MYEQYTDEQIVEMLIPKMNKCSKQTKWDGLIEKPWGNADLFKAIATVYRSAYIRGQLGRSFIIDKPKQTKHWVSATRDNVKVGSKVRMIDEEAHNEYPRWFPAVWTVGVVWELDYDNCEVQWPEDSTSWGDKWWCNYEHLEVLLCE